VNAQRMRQTVIGILILVALAMFWRRDETPVGPENTGAAPPNESSSADTKPSLPEADADFSYYVLVLSWSPTHCAGDAGRGRDDDLQCRSGRPFGFVLHGLWPQNQRGYPEHCSTIEPRAVADDVMEQALKLSPSALLIQHEWDRHGTCSGLPQEAYFSAAAAAIRSVNVPRIYQAPQRPLTTTPDAVRQSFIEANPTLSKDNISATCNRNELAEVWVCLDKTLHARACSNEVRKRHCGGRKVRMLAVRGDWPR